jgi:hypothetical protein
LGRDQLVEILEPVLHRCRGEQQQVAGLQRADEQSRRIARVAQPVRLIRDGQIPPHTRQSRLQRGPASRGDRRQPDRLRPTALTVADEVRGVDRGQTELALQLLAPLLHQTSRRDHQHAVGQPAHPQLGQDQPGLDRLAETNLVSEDRSAAHPSQHHLRGAYMEVERFEGKLFPAEQGLESSADSSLPRLHRSRTNAPRPPRSWTQGDQADQQGRRASRSSGPRSKPCGTSVGRQPRETLLSHTRHRPHAMP